MMKHLYLFSNTSRAAQYGVGTYLCQLQESLKGELPITVIIINSEEKEVKMIKNEGSRIIHIPELAYKDTKANFLKYYRNLVYILDAYIDKSEEAIFVLNYLHMSPLVQLLRKQFQSCKVYVAVHYLNWCFTLNGNMKKFHHLLVDRDNDSQNLYEEYLRDRKLFSEVDKVICLSSKTCRLLEEEYQIEHEKLTVIYNGLKDRFVPIGEEACRKLKCSLSFEKGEQIVLFVGRLDHIKGVEFLIKAFRKVLEILPHTYLLIIGNGSYDSYLKECSGIRSRILFTGKIDKEELYSYYQIADVGVLPSFHEQCSYVAIEMMMNCVPLIGTSSTGLGEMIEYELRIPLNEDDELQLPIVALADRIIQVLQAPDKKWNKMSRRKYVQQYTLEKMKKQYMNLLFNE